jgi:hypothetical protein
MKIAEIGLKPSDGALVVLFLQTLLTNIATYIYIEPRKYAGR